MSIKRFSELMTKELDDNDHKGGWLNCDPKDLLIDLCYHSSKLGWALKSKDLAKVKEYAADTANLAMMVLESFEQRYEEPSITQIVTSVHSVKTSPEDYRKGLCRLLIDNTPEEIAVKIEKPVSWIMDIINRKII